jgi:8-oxo-dGTP diphosphatase
MFLFTSQNFHGDITSECDEGELAWVDKKDILSLNLWEGDKYFLDLLSKDFPFFSMKLSYEKDKLIEIKLDGKTIVPWEI